jgi:2-keto-4-pentenoate hydratase
MSPEHLEAFATRVWSARAAGRTLQFEDVEAECGGPFEMDEAYRIGDLLLRRRLERGERPAGWKLGYTSQAMRAQMGVAEPNFGRLTDAMLIEDGAPVPETVLQPRVEPEIAIRIERTPDTVPTSTTDVLAVIGEVRACLEVVDSVWTDYRFRIEHNTADGSSAAYVVLGGSIPNPDLASVSVRLFHNDAEVAQATGAAASGDPLAGVVWLATQLAARGHALRAGDVVITGGLTAAIPIGPGDRVHATFDDRSTASTWRRPTQR